MRKASRIGLYSLDFGGLKHLLEFRRFLGPAADPEPEHRQRQRQQERNAPGPLFVSIGAKDHIQPEDQSAGEDAGKCRGGNGDAEPQSAAFQRCMLQHEGRRTDGFPAGREALDEPEEHQQDRCSEPDGRIRRHESDADGRQADAHQGDEQDRPASDAVAQRAEEQPAKRTDQEGHAEGGEGGEHRRERRSLREEVRRQNQRTQTIQAEIVELDELSDGARRQNPLLHGAGRFRHGIRMY